MRAEQSRAEQSRAEQRNTVIDIAKGIGMLLVVFGHLSERTQALRILAYSFHMPLFFIISGFLLNMKKTVRQSIGKDLLKFVLPAYGILLFDSMICLLRYVMVDKAVIPSLIDWIKGVLLYGGVLWNSPIWFLLTLFLCKYLFVYCNRLQQVLPYIVALFCICICSMDINRLFPSWWLFNVIMAFPFFVAGVFVKYIWGKMVPFKAWVSIILTGVWIVLSLYNGYTDIHIQMNGKNYLLFLVTGMIGSYLCVILSAAISKARWCRLLEYIGRNSFIVLITHYYVCRGFIPVTLNYFNVKSNIWMQCFMTLVVILLYYGIFSTYMWLNKNKILAKLQ